MYGFADKNANASQVGTTRSTLEIDQPRPVNIVTRAIDNRKLKDMLCCSIILITGFATGIIVGSVSLILSGISSRQDNNSFSHVGTTSFIAGHMIHSEWHRTCGLHNSTTRAGVMYTTSMCIATISHGNYFNIFKDIDGNIQTQLGLSGQYVNSGCARYCWIVKNCYVIPENPNIKRCNTLPSCEPLCNAGNIDTERYSFRVETRYST